MLTSSASCHCWARPTRLSSASPKARSPCASTDDKGRGHDQAPADLTGEPLKVAFNAGLLLKTLQQIDGPITQLGFTTPTEPALLDAPDQADIFQGLIMPIRLSNISG
ncbi:hypothetical protein [Streptomyces caniscabiei]|uniref:hypothetical protein n=1 Tax=Streptomyces caniscabiei TaxID=2746961 RepID=UPI0015C50574|nr:hypothetical protein [Streptomyces caniscabiei]